MPEQQATVLSSGRSIILKDNIDSAVAEKYRLALEKQGSFAVLLPQFPVPPPPPVSPIRRRDSRIQLCNAQNAVINHHRRSFFESARPAVSLFQNTTSRLPGLLLNLRSHLLLWHPKVRLRCQALRSYQNLVCPTKRSRASGNKNGHRTHGALFPSEPDALSLCSQNRY